MHRRYRGSSHRRERGNALIPTANAMNPTLMSVAIAVRGARKAIEELSRQSYSLTEKLYTKLGGQSEEGS